jgi:predicted nuclease of restriction endonuclease-like RecB superfamily
MLPSELLRARISSGKIRPLYVSLDAGTLALAEKITAAFREGIGKRKGELLERLKEIESEGQDFKLVRGLSTLLERRSVFAVESELNPMEARTAVFREASNMRVSDVEERSRVLQRVSARLGVSPDVLEKALFSDLDEELIMREFKPLASDSLLKYYNLSVTQTLLFKSLRVEFSASGNWKNIFRDVKRLGLIYSVEMDAANGGDGAADRGSGYRVSIDGPLSIFKMTERYGTSIAKLLPQITTADSWSIKAEILARSRGGKIYNFEADSKELKNLITNVRRDGQVDGEQPTRVATYDSTTEERFAKSFLSYGTGWILRREPEPLVAGTHVLIPDFSFEKDGMKVYLEVVGFWTPDYLERKIRKLSSITGIDMIIAVDESLACSKLERLKSKALVIYYKREVPLKPIIEHLKEREGSIVKAQVEKLKSEEIILDGDVISIGEIAIQRGVAPASIRLALRDFRPDDHVRIGDQFISKTKLNEIDKKLTGVEMLTDALSIIEASGVKEEGGKVLDILGYASTWEGLEMDKVRISRVTPKTAAATSTSGSSG